MKIKLIYPKWPKLKNQPVFNLPPVGPTVFAASLPQDVDIDFVDENVEPIVDDDNADLVAISVMLSCQIPRAWEIARSCRDRGQTVIMGASSNSDIVASIVSAMIVPEW